MVIYLFSTRAGFNSPVYHMYKFHMGEILTSVDQIGCLATISIGEGKVIFCAVALVSFWPLNQIGLLSISNCMTACAHITHYIKTTQLSCKNLWYSFIPYFTSTSLVTSHKLLCQCNITVTCAILAKLMLWQNLRWQPLLHLLMKFHVGKYKKAKCFMYTIIFQVRTIKSCVQHATFFKNLQLLKNSK